MGQLWLFGGKGGVGKTTSACATAIWTAKCGLTTLLVSSDPAHSTSDSLDFRLGSEPTAVDGVEGLYGMELDLQATMDAIMPAISDAIRSSGGTPLPFSDDNFAELKEEVSGIESSDLLLPGLDEALAFDQLLRQVEDTRFDLIVFDTAPTGHTLRFLSLPELLDVWSARIAKFFRAMGGMRSVIFGGKQEKSIREELDKFQRRVQHIRRVLSDSELTRFTMVTIPESMAVSESARAAESLSSFEIDINGVIVNRVTPDLEHPFLQERRMLELERINEIEQIFSGEPLIAIPLQETDVRGIDNLEELSELLHGPPMEFPEDMSPHIISKNIPTEIRRSRLVNIDDDCTIVELYLAGSKKPDIGLRAEGKRLFIAINGRENIIDLNHTVDAVATKAKMSGDILKVRIPRPLDSK